MTAQRIELGFRAEDAADAIAQAKAWVAEEPTLRLRTVASARPQADHPGFWTVVLAVVTVPAEPLSLPVAP